MMNSKPTITVSSGFASWLASTGGSLAFSTYRNGRVFLVSVNDDGALHILDRAVGTAMGLAYDGGGLWIGARDQIWYFADVGARSIQEGRQDADAVFMPRRAFLIGNSNTHDIVADASLGGVRHDLVYANTQYSCLAAPDPHYTFRPLWSPPFISDLVPEDRCHLNGVCAENGEVAYVTICGEFDTTLGWKVGKRSGGFIMDVRSGDVVATGLSMPHSPRVHDGRLWVINSGEGDLGTVEGGRFVPLAGCPGFARGLCFVDSHAVVALSRLRETEHGISPHIDLLRRLKERGVVQRCGLMVYDTDTGRLAHWLTISGDVSELYDVIFLPGIRRPYSPGFREAEEHRRFVRLPPA